MNTNINYFIRASCALLGVISAWGSERFHVEPILPSSFQATTPAAGNSSGGNVGSYPNNSGSIPHDQAGRFYLAESSIAYNGPTSQGGANFEGGVNTRKELMDSGMSQLVLGTPYKTMGIPGNWQIYFPGVVDVATGTEAQGVQNFFPDRVQKSIDYYRAAAKAFPNDLQIRIQLIEAIRAFMVPHVYAGNNAFARATKERVINAGNELPGNGEGNPSAIGRELQKLQQASSFYATALDAFIDAAASFDTSPCVFADLLPSDLTETNPLSLEYRESQKQLCSSFARALSLKGETTMRSLNLRYFQAYDAASGTPPTAVKALIAEVDAESRALEYQLLLVTPLETYPWFPAPQFSSARALLSQLRELRSSMQEGSLVFTSTNADFNVSTNVYGVSYVPFMFEPTEFSTPTSFAGLTGAARDAATKSEQQDSTAASSIGQLDFNLQTLASRLNEIHDQYNSQLAQLCGTKDITENGALRKVPDVEGAILPPEERIGWESRPIGDRGSVGDQWYAIDAAELAMERALGDLNRHLESIDKKRSTWQEIKGSQEELIQNVIIGTGEKIDQLNKDSIEARIRFGEYQARLAKKKRKRSLFSSIAIGIASVVAAPLTGGTSLLATLALSAEIANENAGYIALGTTLVGEVAKTADAYSAASLEIKGIRSQTELERKLGEINAKKEELAYLERAALQFNQIEIEGYRVEEAIQAMMLETKALEIQIEMAELNVDREYAKLSSMLSRISYLLQQQSSALSLVNTNPLNSPDFRLIRDQEVRQAEEQFLFAQEQAFLAGRAALYSMVSATRRQNVTNLNSLILQARTGRRLTYLLDRIQAQAFNQTSELGTRAPTIVNVKIRDHLIQHNNVVRNSNGEIDFELPNPWEPQGLVPANSTTQRISNEAWTAFLQSRIDERGVLNIPFRLSFSSWTEGSTRITDGSRIQNPLFGRRMFGARIFYKEGTPYFGTKINIHGSGFEGLHPTFFPIRAYLTPEGSSYVRTLSYQADPLGQSLLVYQLGTQGATAAITCSIGGVPPENNFNPQLHERTPANDRWVLSIDPSEGGNALLLSTQLAKISDISITFSLSAYTSQ